MESIVLFPSPGMGHLASMVELGKLMLTQEPSLSLHFLIATPPFNLGNTTPYIKKISATNPSIIFHHLPTLSDLPQDLAAGADHSIPSLICYFLRLNNPNVRNLLQSLSQSCNVRAFVVDVFCASAFAIGFQLKIPTYLYYTASAGALCSILHFPTIHRNTTKSLKDDVDLILEIPGLPPFPAKDMATPALDRTTIAYECFLEGATNYVHSAGILVNTFESLEPTGLNALCDGLCFPDHPTPPIFCVGPLIVPQDNNIGTDIIQWLDSQPSQSVVFLSFGSLGVFSMPQLREIAIGLEKSGQRFLWVVRNPPPDAKNEQLSASAAEPNLDSLLPDGFLNRTKERGLVVKQWAPQLAILNHGSIGGFVTHCGWNSVLEAICAGVPMLGWPLYADQRLTRVLLVEDLKLALPVNEGEDGFVSADEVEKRVSELMNWEEGNSIKKQVIAKRDEAKVAMSEAGSSRVALAKWAESWKHN